MGLPPTTATPSGRSRGCPSGESGRSTVGWGSGPPCQVGPPTTSQGTLLRGACDPQPMAQECLDRVQASLVEDLQWDQSNIRTALSSHSMCMASSRAVMQPDLTSPVAAA